MKLNYRAILIFTALLLPLWMLSSCAPHESGNPASSSATTAPAAFQSGDTAINRTMSGFTPKPDKRPGLGTGWGNQVSSNVGYTSFTRASSKPAGVSSIYYNDKEGVDAMAGSWKYSGNGMQKAAGGLIEWGVKGGWGMLKNYHSGSRRYVVGRKGSNYSLLVKNLSHSALEVVLSVDGLDVMNGRPASFKKRGYIIQPGKTLKVKGFRTSESAVAAFKFSSVSGSYSSLRHGKTRNVGVIGMAVFTQRGVDPWKWSRPTVEKRHAASPFAEAPFARAR